MKVTEQEKSLQLECSTIQESVHFYEEKIQVLFQKIDKLERTSWRPDYNEKMDLLHAQISQIINKLNFEQKQMVNFEIKMHEYAVHKLSSKIEIIFNPNKTNGEKKKK